MSTTVQELETQALSIPERAKAIVVSNNETYLDACDVLKTIKDLRANIAATFDPMREAAHTAWKETINQQKKVEAPLEEGEAAVKQAISKYLAEQERLRKEAELLAQKAAQEEAERQQLADASLLDEMGETDMANAMLAERATAAPVILPRTVPKVSGIVPTKTWDFDIIDPMKIPRQYLVPDLVKIRGVVRALKSSANIPGVRVREVTGISAGRK
jgi:hypothetical protein